MAVRFLFGRAGSGKTYHCLRAIREQLLADPIDGPAQILFTPEQAAVQAERLLLSHKDLVGASRYHTMSFRRLQQMVLADTGFADRELVGPLGRQMILQYLLIRNRRDLQILARVADRPGTAGRVAANIAEFMQEGILPQHLQAIAGQVGNPGDAPPGASPIPTAADPEFLFPDLEPPTSESNPQSVPSRPVASPLATSLPAKLHDLALLYGAYIKWLAARGQADPAGLLALTADRLEQCGWLRGANIWVDGFASFSAQRRYVLARLAKVAGSVEIALLVDPDIIASEQPPEGYDLFYRTWQTSQQLRQAFVEANVEIEEPLVLRKSPPARFRERPILARIESQLFAATGPADPVLPGIESQVEACRGAQSSVGGRGGGPQDRRPDPGCVVYQGGVAVPSHLRTGARSDTVPRHHSGRLRRPQYPLFH